MDKMKFETVDGVVRNVDKIAAIFPQVVTEVKDENGTVKRAVKWDVLKELLSGEYVEGGECYDFTWPGKRAAIAEAAKSIRKTLRPCKAESKNWDTTENLYIEGDNLEVLKLLQESYLGKVKMIYIDPPYNTGNDFVYRDDFKVDSDQWAVDSGELFEDEETGETNRMFKNTESNGRFHSDWCSMIYSRLVLARDLLSEDGVIFISIDDNEHENLKKICDDIFGANNFICSFPRVTKKGGKSSNEVARNHDYVFMYTKSRQNSDLCGISHDDDGYSHKDDFFEERGYYKANQTLDYDSLGYVRTLDYPIVIDNETFYAGGSEENYLRRQSGSHGRADWGWRWSKELYEFGKKHGFIEIHRGGDRPRIYTKTYQKVKIEKIGNEYRIVKFDRTKPLSTLEFTDNKYSNDNAKKVIDDLLEKGVFEYSKPPILIQMLSKLIADKRYTILDFFSGSATTAHAVMQLNAEDGGKRKFIMVQLPEECPPDSEAAKAGYSNICEIGKERIRRAGEKIKEENPLTAADLDVGFRVFKLDDSNMKDVYYSADGYSQDMLDTLVDNIKEDRTDLDLLYGCLLDWGVELSLPHTSETIDGVTVHIVNNGDLVACFDPNIPESAIRTIAKRHPLRTVFRDSSFASAPQKINVEEIFKLLSPTTTIKVI